MKVDLNSVASIIILLILFCICTTAGKIDFRGLASKAAVTVITPLEVQGKI